MRTLKIALAAWLGTLIACPALAAGSGIRIDYSEPLERLSVPAANAAAAPDGTSGAMRFQAFGRQFDFSLEPNRALLSSVERRISAAGIEVYRGAIAGRADTWARFVVADGVPRGMFFDGSELYAVDTSVTADRDETAIIYRLSDLVIAAGTLGCAHVEKAKTAAELFAAVQGETGAGRSQGPGAVSNMDIGLVADFEFTSVMGPATDLEMITRMNIVDGIFSSQLGVQLTVTHIDSFSSANDPFSDTTDSGVLIDEVADFRFQSVEQSLTGLTHLYTGRDLDGTNVGVAYSSALCSNFFGAGLTQGTHGAAVDALITAHEMGHNFGAPHDGTSGSACESTPMTFLMAPSVNGNDQFSSCSITEMQDDVAAAACITPLPSTDIAVVAGSVPATAYTDDAVSVTFDVDSVGTEDATGVTLDVTIPPTVSVNGVSSTSGSCSSGAGIASCTLGTIAGGSGVTVTLDTVAASAGDASFAATGAADADANANNNQDSAGYTITAAVDLAILPAATAQVALNQAIMIRPVLENRSSLEATNVTLTVTPDAGLRIDSASWASGSCAIDSSGVATCQAASVTGQASTSVDVQVTGIVEGARLYSVAVTASETDRDVSNNDRGGQVTVGAVIPPPSPEPESSGGGAFDWLSLLLLAAAGAGLRRRAGRVSAT